MYRTENNVMAETISASVQGATHIREGKICQDAVSIKEGSYRSKPYLVCSVADGHGGEDYLYSHIGSLLALQSAEKTAMQFVQTGITCCDNCGEYFGNYVSRHLKDEWLESIRQSWEQFRIDQDLVRRHGTTILSVLFYEGYAYMAQLGDGNICYLDNDGSPVFLVEPDDGPSDSTTDSLCSRNANKYWNFACVPEKDIAFLMMSTDGLINSMAGNDGYVKFAKILQGYLEKFRPSEINAALPEWLTDYSEKGCGDDISLAAINLSTTNKPGDKNNENTEDTRTEKHQETGGGRTGGNFRSRKKWTAFRIQALQRFQRHPGSEKYYLLPGAARRSGRRLRG